LIAHAAAGAEDSYPGYGYEPTEEDHIGETEYSPCLNIGYPQRVYWGDTHLHTSFSTDAGMIGALMLAYWKDPAFDPTQRAFYYVRVLEIPTPRWTTYDAAFLGVALPEGVPPTQQERAYTSPIWYTPRG
jgi:hypothetical protein